MPRFPHEIHDAVAKIVVLHWTGKGMKRNVQDLYQDAYEVSLKYEDRFDESLGTRPVTYLSRCAISKCYNRMVRRDNPVSTSSNGKLKEMGTTTMRVSTDALMYRGRTADWESEPFQQHVFEKRVTARMTELASTLEDGTFLLKLALGEIKVSQVAQGAEAHRLYRRVVKLKKLFAKDPVLAALAHGTYGEDTSTNH